VTESRYRITQLQPKGGNHHAVYFQHQVESLSYHYYDFAIPVVHE
jgi:hypothetical protein